MNSRTISFKTEIPGRLDKILGDYLKSVPQPQEISRSQLQRAISEGGVTVDGRVVMHTGFAVESGMQIAFTPPAPPSTTLASFETEFEVLHEDSDCIVINKPPGLTMHPGAGNSSETLANALVGRMSPSGGGESHRPGIVHRLDKDTSGVVVVAKNPESHAALTEQFSKRTTARAYKALVLATPRGKRAVDKDDSGTIDAPIGRHPAKRTLMAVIPDGRKAVTHWSAVERMPHGCLLDLRLETGRTHQLRVHLNHVGSPIIGDPVYGDFSSLPKTLREASEKFGRQALHAYMLGFRHPRTGEALSFNAPLPADFEELVSTFRSEIPRI